MMENHVTCLLYSFYEVNYFKTKVFILFTPKHKYLICILFYLPKLSILNIDQVVDW